MRALSKSQLDESSYTGNGNAAAFAESALNGSGRKDPSRGLWVLPGGGVVFGETFADTLRRELREEAGIEIHVDRVLNVYELITPPDEHRVIVYMTARYGGGEPLASDDLSEVAFFGSDELRKMSRDREISPFVEKVLREVNLL